MKGKFITIEGVEGCGKSTQINLIAEYLKSRGHVVDVTREPGGTAISEAIRDLLLDPQNEDMGSTTELLLYEAARAQHVKQRIKPALEAGTTVICDRFVDSTTAYQGAGRGIPFEDLDRLHSIATDNTWPDLTIIIDLPAAVGLNRAKEVGESDRIEQESIDFHQRVRSGFLNLAQEQPERIKVVDGSKGVNEVFTDICALIDQIID